MLQKNLPLLVLFLLIAIPVAASAEQFSIFNEEEARLLMYSEEQWLSALTAYHQQQNLLNDTQPYGNIETPLQKKGPSIDIIDPTSSGDHYRATIPLKLLIYLKSRQAPINMQSLKVKGKRGIFSLDITKRLTAFLRQPEGKEDADYVIDAKIPNLGAGHYHVALSLADIDGNQVEQSAFIEVTNK